MLALNNAVARLLACFVLSRCCMLIAAVEGSLGNQAWVLLAVGAACLASSLVVVPLGNQGEACQGASAQETCLYQ